MTWSAPSAFTFSALASSPTVVKTVQPIAFAILMATVPMPERAGLDQDRFAGLELGIVEQHVLDRREGDRRAGGVAHRDARRHLDDEPLRHVDELVREAVDVEAHDAAHVFAEIVAAVAAGLADAAGERAVHHHRIAGREARDAGADRGDLARRLGADDERQLALGERHAAIAPDVDVVERDRPDADLHLAGAGRRRRVALDELDLAISDEGERAHRVSPGFYAAVSGGCLSPPKARRQPAAPRR